MNVSLTDPPTPVVSQPQNRAPGTEPSFQPPISTGETAFRLGLWLSGLQSFARLRGYYHPENSRGKASAPRDWKKEFGLTSSALLLCADLCLRLSRDMRQEQSLAESENDEFGLSENLSEFDKTRGLDATELLSLAAVLKDLSVLNEAFLRAAPLRFAEWSAWSGILNEKLKNTAIVGKLVALAEREGESFLPSALVRLLQNKQLAPAVEIDLQTVLPRFAKILKWLDVIGEMHRRDEPLKPTLLLFARIHEQAREMMSYANNRLRRFADEEDPFFGVLDCAVYAASMELRKVYGFELTNLSQVRQAPLIYAKIETAYSLLNDCFQQVIVNFAQFIEPGLSPAELFPNFQTKLEQSLALRRDLWNIQQVVQRAEKNPDSYPLEKLHAPLDEFLRKNLRFLFYKDLETVERFVEEVKATRGKKDLVPILHRFGAYLETLLGQVNMRTVLANHPFDFPKQAV